MGLAPNEVQNKFSVRGNQRTRNGSYHVAQEDQLPAAVMYHTIDNNNLMVNRLVMRLSREHIKRNGDAHA